MASSPSIQLPKGAANIPPLQLPVGMQYTLHPMFLDQNGRATSASSPISFSSSDSTIATVDADKGIIVAVAAGSVTITATSGSLSASRPISVYAPVPSKLII